MVQRDLRRRELYVGLFAVAPAESLPRLIFAWRTQVNGRFVQDLPVDRLVPILQRRWAENKGDPAIAEALDLLYEAEDCARSAWPAALRAQQEPQEPREPREAIPTRPSPRRGLCW